MARVEMVITDEVLQRLDQHWAIQALGETNLKRALQVSQVRIIRSAVARQMAINFEETSKDNDVVERAAIAYEIAAIEGLDALFYPSSKEERVQLRLQAQAGAFRAYSLKKTLPIPSETTTRIFHILHLAALAYSGDQWTDLRRWLKDHEKDARAPSVATSDWEHRILYRLFDCWVRLLRKQGWDDLDGVREIIAGLRKDQEQYEKTILDTKEEAEKQSTALRLIALYHWAKATELLAIYMLQGQPITIDTELDKHFEAGQKAATATPDISLSLILRWLHVTAHRMTISSLWKVAQAVNSRVTSFVQNVTKARSMFELLPPQRVAVQEQGLLDQASRAVVIDLPTSGGKTILAQFRILQALNQFDADNGWVAYVAPTRALVSQITRRLREDFTPIGVRVEQLTGAVEIDSFEEVMLTSKSKTSTFNVLVATPEKLQFVIRNKKITRPLALIVLDEAHCIEEIDRGLRIELLLATIKRDCDRANFLLLMPYVPNADDLAKWLGADTGRTISLGTTAWQPNERAVGLFNIQEDASIRGGWTLQYETLITTPKTIHLDGRHQVGDIKPLNLPKSKAGGASVQAAAMAKVFSERGTSITVSQQIDHVWSAARMLKENLKPFEEIPSEIALVQRFLKTEISPEFELVDMLSCGIGVHHTGLSDETRTLMEWLTEISSLRVLCATTTLAHGINFPVASVFLATRLYPYGKEMSARTFWNLAGRAGRVNQESVGIVGLAAGTDPHGNRHFVSAATGALVSRLVSLLDEVEKIGKLDDLSLIIQQDQWCDFRSYVAHLWNEKQNLEAVLADAEQLLRNTYGFGVLQQQSNAAAKAKTQALLQATTDYARKLANNPSHAILADATGFAPEGVSAALNGLNRLEHKLTRADWEPSSLFGDINASSLPNLIGVMMQIPEIKGALNEISSAGLSHQHIANMTRAWVDGQSIQDMAAEFFRNEASTDAITKTCKAIYKVLTNNGPWGLAALAKIGVDFEKLSDDEKRRINSLPAMIYHGVKSEAAVLMRMNCVPRSIAEPLGKEFQRTAGVSAQEQTVGVARSFLHNLTEAEWAKHRPAGAALTGKDYKTIWERLAGVGN